MSKYNKVSQEDEDSFSRKPPLGFSVKQNTSHCFQVHINTDIYGAEHYSQIFDLLLEAGEEDTVQFFIESAGGDMAGLNTLLEGIKMTDAYVVAVIVGQAHSCASLLALSCHDVIVCDGAEMLCHGVRSGMIGKLADIEAWSEHTKKVANRLLQETYTGFLLPQEISEIQQGRELWLDADQIRDRLEQRAKYFTEGLTKEDNAEVKRTPDVQPQERRSKSKKVQ